MTYYTTYEEQRRTLIGELTAETVHHHLKGLYVGCPLDGEPFGMDGIAIPICRTTPKGRLDRRYIMFTGREMRVNTGERGVVDLITFKLKQFFKGCPKGWIQLKRGRTRKHGPYLSR